MTHFIPTEFDPAASRLIALPAQGVTRPVVCSEPLVESASFQHYRESLRVLDLPGVKLQSRYQALRLQSDGSQVEEERTHLFQGAIGDRRHFGQFSVHIFRLVNQQLARELQTHSDGCQ